MQSRSQPIATTHLLPAAMPQSLTTAGPCGAACSGRLQIGTGAILATARDTGLRGLAQPRLIPHAAEVAGQAPPCVDTLPHHLWWAVDAAGTGAAVRVSPCPLIAQRSALDPRRRRQPTLHCRSRRTRLPRRGRRPFHADSRGLPGQRLQRASTSNWWSDTTAQRERERERERERGRERERRA